MEFRVVDNGIVTYDENGDLGMITYSVAGEKLLIIDHTEVESRAAGQGVGKQLVYQVVALAREQHKKIMPLCPFAQSVFEKNADIQDVLRK